MTLIFVDVEATGQSPFSGHMTEFGAVNYDTLDTFHGVLWESEPHPDNPAVSKIIGQQLDGFNVMLRFEDWLEDQCEDYIGARLVFVSDNVAFDWQWINYEFDKHLGFNPFGHSGRRISDFFAGLNNNWRMTQAWKKWRVTKHDHMPVHDALGNVEAFKRIVQEFNLEIT
jgi:DNA polymerase III epsilon subunit-like protein